jgi:hypothetical protein
MSEDIINPFKQSKNINWAQKSKERLYERKEREHNKAKPVASSQISKDKGKPQERVAKSFKIYKGSLSRTFDKRVKKMQVKYDDLDYEKDYVDSGKYVMFLMAFAEECKLYDLYKRVDGDGNITIDKQEILNHFAKILKEK